MGNAISRNMSVNLWEISQLPFCKSPEDRSHTNVTSTLQLLHIQFFVLVMLVGKAAILFVSSAFFEEEKNKIVNVSCRKKLFARL